MGTIPAPNIADEAGQIAQAPQNALAEYARTAQLKQQTSNLQQEQQERSLQMQAQQRQLNDQDALTKAMTQYDPQKHTLADIPKLVTSNGGSGQAALTAQAGLVQQRQNLLKLSDDQFAQEQKKADLIQGVHDEVSQAAPELKQQTYQAGLQKLSGVGVDTSKESPQYPGDDEFAKHLPAIRLHSAIVAEAEKDRETSASELKAQADKQKADQENFQVIPELGVRVNKTTGETSPVSGAMMPPAQMESKYVALQQKKAAGQPLSVDDAGFVKGYEKYKTLVPQFNITQTATGAGMIPGAGQTGGQGGPPPTVDAIPNSIKGTVKQILDYRAQLPPAGRSNPTNTAIRYWVNALDPQHDDSTFPARNKLMTAFTSGTESHQINSTNTAIGHIGVLGDAIDGLKNGDVKVLNKVANSLGVQVGATPQTTFNTIVHRVGPELAAAYIQGGGGEGERGTTAADFDPSLGPDQLKQNVAITAKLLRSKIGSLENQYKQTMGRDDFQQRFITPEAQSTLTKWSPQGGAQGGGSGKSVSLAAAKQLPQNAGKSDAEIKSDIEKYGHTVAP
jgi:hypothetical protein